MKKLTGYLAADGFEAELLEELKTSMQVEEVHERLILASGEPIEAAWAQNIWRNPQKIEFESISQAAQALRALQRNWALYSIQAHRRAQLITEKLPKLTPRVLDGPTLPPSSPMGSWSLLSEKLLIASASCSSAFPNGEVRFHENKTVPPSRAYLKLWEALTVAGDAPRPGDRCLDLGSSPGSWTWALQGLGADVLSIDRSFLAPQVAHLPGVQFIQGDAFRAEPGKLAQTFGGSLEPAFVPPSVIRTRTGEGISTNPEADSDPRLGPHFEKVDWFFSDVICYPRKLLELVQKWLRDGTCSKYVCTIKFQGQEISDADRQVLESFARIPGSRLLHLFHNKHELTWIKV